MTDPKKKKKESPLINLAINIIIPIVILMKFSGEDKLGPVNGLLLAISFPLFYGIYEFVKDKKVNFISILGLISILFTGIIGILQLDAHWIAVKEAAVPLVIGIAVVVSLWTPFPLVKKLLFNEQIIDVAKINKILDEKGNHKLFEKRLTIATYLLAASFLLSAILNYVLAKVIVKSASGTEAFNQELGKMQSLSFPVIAVPSTIVMGLALWYLVHGVKKLTDLELKEIFNDPENM
ncbi:VC0807 family protein [Chondrinema litorale]|uniref:VC0807 family protein n=1 Tax=Chondrinema litorale TaxID=2994555 RepID=UPI002543C26D|nr:VC0807 family protein [Chondrinema litorale]UZR94544.1 MFS transporter [Chondrinema litorale]